MPYLRKAKDIRDEIAPLDDPGSPEKCCCIHVTCSEESGHEQGKCKNRTTATLWKARVESYCSCCREYQYDGPKPTRGPTTS